METRSNYVMVGAVTVALLAGVLLFIVWLAGISGGSNKCYDIYFPAVGGINKGSNVSFSGVSVGQVQKISLLPNRPEFVWVRIEVDQQTPVLEGTTAQIKSVSLAGANEIQLDGAQRGRPAITQVGPQGCPVIPASTSGLSALLNSAPELLERIQRLTERLTELLSDKNQNAISDILENIDIPKQSHGTGRADPDHNTRWPFAVERSHYDRRLRLLERSTRPLRPRIEHPRQRNSRYLAQPQSTNSSQHLRGPDPDNRRTEVLTRIRL